MSEAVVAAIIISSVTAAASAGISYDQARTRNKAMKKSQASARKIFESRSTALRDRRKSSIKGVLEKRDLAVLQQSAGANKAKGQIRVAMAGAGLSTGSGSGLSLLKDIESQQELNNYILRENTRNALEGIQSGFKANSINAMASFEQQFNAAQAQMSNAALSAFASGLGGAGTGLAITGGLKDMGAFEE